MTRGQRFLMYAMVAMLAANLFRDVTHEGTGKTLYVWGVSAALALGLILVAKALDKR